MSSSEEKQPVQQSKADTDTHIGMINFFFIQTYYYINRIIFRNYSGTIHTFDVSETFQSGKHILSVFDSSINNRANPCKPVSALSLTVTELTGNFCFDFDIPYSPFRSIIVRRDTGIYKESKDTLPVLLKLFDEGLLFAVKICIVLYATSDF
jgi:hypothetical protein